MSPIEKTGKLLRRLGRLARPSPFKVGLLTIAVSLLPIFWEAPIFQNFVRSVDYRMQDFMFMLRQKLGENPRPTGKIVIVDIDEKSLAREGQWPWPRNRMGELLRRIGTDNPLVIGLDIVFAEPDRTSLKAILPQLRRFGMQDAVIPPEALDHDAALGEAIADTPTIVGYYFLMEPDDTKPGAALPLPEFSIPTASLDAEMLRLSDFPRAYRPVLNIPAVSDQALSEGFFNVVSDVDGIVRRGDFFIRFGDILYPSLALEMLREGVKAKPELVFSKNLGITAIQLGRPRVPVNRECQMSLNFRGGPRTFSYVSAVDVLRKRVAKGTFDGKYVLVGTSAIGLLDLRATPLSQAFPGVEINATIIDNVLAGDFMVYDQALDAAIALTVIVLCGLLLNAALAYLGPRLGALAGGLIVAGLALFDYRYLFLHRHLVGITLPLGSLLVLFVAVTVANYFFEGRRKRFIQGAFSHYVSHKVVSTLLKHPEKLSLDGEEKVLTILFSDIRGFTTISEGMGARQLSQFLNEYMTVMTDIVIADNGTVDKFIGDAIMAIWGAPLDDPEHACNAVTAALEMIAALKRLAPAWQARGLPQIDIGIGINTGLVRVGNMGSSTRFDYTVLGDNVNLASRLEGLNKQYGTHILITAATRDALERRVFCRPVDRVRVKGKAHPVDIYEPLCKAPAPPDLVRESERFAEVLALYRSGEFGRAKQLLTVLHDETPRPLYALYLSRIEKLEEQPPPADWDGVTTFTTK